MARISTPLKLLATMATVLCAVSSWAAGLSDESEGGTPKVFCVKHVEVEGISRVELSQQPASYTADQGEQCFEKWYSAEGNPAVNTALESFSLSDIYIDELVLTTDIDLGGYNEASGQCNEDFAPLNLNQQDPITLTSKDTSSVRTIRGICYKAGIDEASFGGKSIGTIIGVNFEKIRLESLVKAGLLGSSVQYISVTKVAVDGAFVKAPVAGILASSVERNMVVADFTGENLYVNSLPELDDSGSFMAPRKVIIGGLVGSVADLNVTKTNIKTLTVSNNPETLVEPMTSISRYINEADANLGGIVGAVGSVWLENVGIEQLQVIDRSDNEKTSALGGLIGFFEGSYFSVQKTYSSIADIYCFKDINCVCGFGAGQVNFTEKPGDALITALANYHYTMSESDLAEGFAGWVAGSYISKVENFEESEPDTVMTEMFNKNGNVVTFVDNGNGGYTRSSENVARANFRNALGRIVETGEFDPETYMFFDEELQTPVPNGVLASDYMTSSKFADILNNVPGIIMYDNNDWHFDENHNTPFLFYETAASDDDEGDQPARVIFEISCALNDGCLTEDELAYFEEFGNQLVGSSEYEFIVGSDGRIENTKWLEFAYNLTLENPDRPSVYWATQDGVPFAKDNVYSSGVFYTLEVGTAPEQDNPDKTKPEDDADLPAVLTVLQSGNAVRLHARAGKADDGEVIQIETELLTVDENGDDYVVDRRSFDVEKNGYHEEENWDVFPLSSGMYLMSVTVTAGNESYTVEYDFEVDSLIAVGSSSTWRMLSLASVDMRKVEWDDAGKFYWWDEFNIAGKYWQYQELSKKDEPEEGRGYWYNFVSNRSLQLKDEAFVDEMEWKLDSVNSGWNMVANPYGWYIDLEVEVVDTAKVLKWAEEEKKNKDVDLEWVEHEVEIMLAPPAVEFWSWNEKKGEYEPADTLRPYEAVWAKVNKVSVASWPLSASPVFVDTVGLDDDEGERKSLNKAVVKTVSGKTGWTLQAILSDANGKMDSWNTLGAGLRAWASEEPPAGMGDRVNLSIVEGGKRLAKSVKAAGEGNAFEWNVELSATSARKGYLEIAGVDALLERGLHVFVTIDGKTREVHSGEKLAVDLSTTAKSANIFVAPTAKRSFASELRGLRAVQSGNALQVSFDASGMDGAKARVDVFDMKGSVVASASQRCVDGTNAFSLEIPHRGLYTVRVAVAGQAAMQRVLLR